MRAYKLLAILLMAIFTSAAFAVNTKIDRFQSTNRLHRTFGITNQDDEFWYAYAVGGATLGNGQNEFVPEDYDVLSGEQYAQLKSINVPKYNWIDEDEWSEATIGLNVTHNGSSYNLTQCSGGFSYNYEGNAHRFILRVIKNGKEVEYINEPTMASSWTQVTLSSFERNQFDEINCYGGEPCPTRDENIQLDLSQVKQILWQIRPDETETIRGNLKVKDFTCLGGSIFVEPLPTDMVDKNSPRYFTATYGQALSTIANLPAGYDWQNPDFVLDGAGMKRYNVIYNGGAVGEVSVEVGKAAGIFGSALSIERIYEEGLTLAKLNLDAAYAWAEVNVDQPLNVGAEQLFRAYKKEDANHFASDAEYVSVTIIQANGIFSPIEARQIDYTPTLTLAGVSLPSNYVWVEPSTTLNAGDGQTFAATYTDPSGNYEPVTSNIVVNVSKIPGNFGSHAAISEIPYTEGLTLADLNSELTTGYAWAVPTTPLNAGANQSIPAIKLGNNNYYDAEGTITVSVTQATGTFVALDDALSTTYTEGLTLASVTPPDGYAWVAPTTSLSAGNDQEFEATYTKNPNYTTSEAGTITVNVAQATGTFVALGGALSTTYTEGLTLASVTPPPGYAWVTSTTSLSAGTNSYPATYTKNSNYTTSEAGNITVNVAQATGTFVALEDALSTTYTEGLTLTALNSQLPAGYAWVTPATALSAGNDQEFAATYTKNPNYTQSAPGNITVNVAKATPSALVLPTATGITYGAALSTSALTGGTTGGTWAWKNGSTIPDVTNAGYVAVFTPTDDVNYDWAALGDDLEETVSITVAKATRVFATYEGDALSTTYAPNLALSSLTPTGNSIGSYRWADGTELLTVAKSSYDAIFFDPAGNYEDVTGTIAVTVGKQVLAELPALNALASVTYSPTLKLSDVILPAGYTWDAPTTRLTVASSDGEGFDVNYDNGNQTATGKVAVVVNGAAPDYALAAKPTALEATYGETLAAVALVVDGWEWVNAAEDVGNFGTDKPFSARYTPIADSLANYIVKVYELNVTVNKAAIAFVVPTVAAVTYSPELTLDDVTLPQYYSWVAPTTALAVINSGTAYAVTYDNGNETATGTVAVVVNKAPTPTPTGIIVTYSEGLKLSDLTSRLPALYTWADDVDTDEELFASVGNYVFLVTYEEDDNYFGGDVGISVVVNKANLLAFPEYAGDLPEDLVYSPTLTLNNVTLTGGYAWKYPTTVPGAGSHGYAASYTDPSGNYNAKDGFISLNIAKASVVKPELASGVSFEYNGGEKVYTTIETNDKYTVGGTTKATNASTTPYSVTVALKDTANYQWVGGGKENLTGTWTITKAGAPTLAGPAAIPFIYEGTRLGVVSLRGDEAYGKWDWTNPDAVSESGDGEAEFGVTFTPNSSYSISNYNWNTALFARDLNIAVKTVEEQRDAVVASIKGTVETNAIPFSKSADNKYVKTATAGALQTALNAEATNILNTLLASLGDIAANGIVLSIPGTSVPVVGTAVGTDGSTEQERAEEAAADAAHTAVYTAATQNATGTYTYWIKVKRNPYDYIGPFVVTIPAIPQVATPPTPPGGGNPSNPGGGNPSSTVGSVGGSDPGTTPILSQVGNNHIVQIAGGLNLSVKNSAIVSIYGMKGNLVQTQSYTSGDYSISLNHLPKGMYVAKVLFRNRENTHNNESVIRVTVK